MWAIATLETMPCDVFQQVYFLNLYCFLRPMFAGPWSPFLIYCSPSIFISMIKSSASLRCWSRFPSPPRIPGTSPPVHPSGDHQVGCGGNGITYFDTLQLLHVHLLMHYTTQENICGKTHSQQVFKMVTTSKDSWVIWTHALNTCTLTSVLFL